MKLYNIFRLSAVALVALCASCSNEDIESSSKGMITKTFFATQGESVGTRTAIDSNDNALWSDGDAITVFDAAHANNKLTLSAGAGTNNGTFTGKVNTEGNQWYAIYPYNEAATISGNVVSGVTLPAQQVAKAGLFDTNAYLLTSSTTNENLAFKQVTCLVEVTTLAPASKIVFKSNSTEQLAGTLSLAIGADGIATYNVTSNGSTEVTLVPDASQTSIPAGTYHICILPQTFTQGITIEVFSQDSSSILINSTNNSTDKFARGKVIDLGSTSGWTLYSNHTCQHYYEYGKGAKTYVNLGLSSGLKWATTNLGAMEPWEYGDYYAWGATVPWLESYDLSLADVSNTSSCTWNDTHNSYSYSNAPYIYELPRSEPFNFYFDCLWSKYTDNTSANNAPNANSVDLRKTKLDAMDDAATQQWGTGWRMPTDAEFTNMKANTYWVWEDSYKGTGIPGYIVYKAKTTSAKGKVVKPGESDGLGYSLSDTHIFLPTSGMVDYQNISNYSSYSGYEGRYWTSNVYGSDPDYAYSFYFTGQELRSRYFGRNLGFAIRPVHN